jgi:hypothetical protein
VQSSALAEQVPDDEAAYTLDNYFAHTEIPASISPSFYAEEL